jgi:muramoyltetrapeptide carboxypeptidase
MGLIAPSGCISDIPILDNSIARLEARGWRVKQGANIRRAWKYFSATDAERLTELHAMAADPEVDVVMAVRGGYGFSRLLDRIDYAALAASGKIFVGFSDFTALNLALLARANYQSISGPMARVDFGDGEVDALMEAHFWPLLSDAAHNTPDLACEHPHGPQRIEGIAWGTNLTLIANMAGTPYMPAFDNGILFLEEIGEEPYHIDRCLYQLKQAGVLDRQAAIILGTFNGYDKNNEAAKRFTMEDVTESLRQLVNCPVLTNYPFGHAAEKICVPVGGNAVLDIAPTGYRLSFSGHNR